jgi:hypothetical protein
MGGNWRCKPWSAQEREVRHALFYETPRPHVPPAVLEDRDRRAALVPATLGELLFGDPVTGSGRSALDKLRRAQREPSPSLNLPRLARPHRGRPRLAAPDHA